MSPFREVEDHNAGPSALGILVPPGRQTFVILRPRALPWDLVLTRDAQSTSFREIFRDEAPRAVQAIRRALECWSQGGPGDLVSQPAHSGYWLRCTLGDFHFIACSRLPGKPYEPHSFTGTDQTQRAIDDMLAVLHPRPGAVQQIYSNTRHFEK
jgi:hypothetical protein